MSELYFKWEHTYRKLGDKERSNMASIGTGSDRIIDMVVLKVPGKHKDWVCFVYTMGGIAHAGGGATEFDARLSAEDATINLLDTLGLSLPKGYGGY